MINESWVTLGIVIGNFLVALMNRKQQQSFHKENRHSLEVVHEVLNGSDVGLRENIRVLTEELRMAKALIEQLRSQLHG